MVQSFEERLAFEEGISTALYKGAHYYKTQKEADKADKDQRDELQAQVDKLDARIASRKKQNVTMQEGSFGASMPRDSDVDAAEADIEGQGEKEEREYDNAGKLQKPQSHLIKKARELLGIPRIQVSVPPQSKKLPKALQALRNRADKGKSPSSVKENVLGMVAFSMLDSANDHNIFIWMKHYLYAKHYGKMEVAQQIKTKLIGMLAGQSDANKAALFTQLDKDAAANKLDLN